MKLIESILTIAASQGLRIAILIAQSKAVAMILGPQGLALLSVYRNLQQTIVIGAGLGVPSGAVREIASTRGAGLEIKTVVRALTVSVLIQAFVAALLMVVFQEKIASFAFGQPALNESVLWLALCIGVSLYASVQSAILQGMRETKAVAKATIYGSLGGFLLGVPSIYFFGSNGLIAFVLMQAIPMALISRYYVARAGINIKFKIGAWRELLKSWRPMVNLGFAFMLGGLVSSATLLAVRSYVINELGLSAAGQFSAAWVVSVQYLGFLLTAMAVDYYPRLTEVITNPESVRKTVGDQMEITLIIGIPLMMIMIGFSSVFTTILYSSEFEVAAELLTFQMLGSVLKLAVWPFSYLIVAKGQSRLFLLTEVLWNISYMGMVMLMLPRFGVLALGYAFICSYALYGLFVALAVGWDIVRSMTLFSSVMIFSSLMLGALVIFLRDIAPLYSMIFASFFSVAYSVSGFRRLLRLLDRNSRLGRIVGRYFRVGVR